MKLLFLVPSVHVHVIMHVIVYVIVHVHVFVHFAFACYCAFCMTLCISMLLCHVDVIVHVIVYALFCMCICVSMCMLLFFSFELKCYMFFCFLSFEACSAGLCGGNILLVAELCSMYKNWRTRPPSTVNKHGRTHSTFFSYIVEIGPYIITFIYTIWNYYALLVKGEKHISGKIPVKYLIFDFSEWKWSQKEVSRWWTWMWLDHALDLQWNGTKMEGLKGFDCRTARLCIV